MGIALRFIHRTKLSSNGETSKFNSSKAEKDLRIILERVSTRVGRDGED